ncbi:hypothetical protein A2Z33_04695 [Candidatus Gottesmanbacteria bacterium RBG_16_52_11]|uniref:Glycosyl transferase family 1 domain-containing protein n=1 Tax=Candidatus Gottesmanbacteria bacterium RBG_16_52_11 TaxID=1798374 RepID=A0A1F5YU64_9BACT|nr:MAG: hypothetical protein A2Z33_04695 [Candidatus Gottesmanbacteria bacterium RBG_16_52_11]
MIGFIYDLSYRSDPASYPGSADRLRSQTDDLVRRADLIVAVSESVRREILKAYDFPSDRIHVVYPGVDREFSPAAEPYRHPKPYFLSVGAVKPGKKLPDAIRAFGQFIESSGRDFDFLIAGGDYWPDPAVGRTIRDLGLGARVKLLGHVSRQLLPNYYRGAVALICASGNEGFCLPAAEAMASGTPVVAVRSGALAETIGDGGIFAEPGDTDGLADALVKIAASPLLRRKLSSQGIVRSKRYSWRAFARGVFNLYADHQAAGN